MVAIVAEIYICFVFLSFFNVFAMVVCEIYGFCSFLCFFNAFALVVVWELWKGLGISGMLWDTPGCFGRPWEALGGSGKLWGALLAEGIQGRSIKDLLRIFLQHIFRKPKEKDQEIHTGLIVHIPS